MVNNDKNFVYAMMSFSVKKDGRIDKGHTMLWEALDDINYYINHINEGQDDRPFECRWDYIVVERVFFGPYRTNEVIGWWKGIPQENGMYRVVELETSPISYAEGTYNFTISG